MPLRVKLLTRETLPRRVGRCMTSSFITGGGDLPLQPGGDWAARWSHRISALSDTQWNWSDACACRPAEGGGQEVALELAGPEASDFLNFVLKDAATGTWYDYNGSNFHVPLRSALVTASMTMSFDLDEEVRAPLHLH